MERRKLRGLTEYQSEILFFILEKVKAGYTPDLDELLDSASWVPTKQAFQFTIRQLVEKGMVEKLGTEVRRGRRRVLIGLGEEGRRVADPRGG